MRICLQISRRNEAQYKNNKKKNEEKNYVE